MQHFSFTLNKVQKLALNIVTGWGGDRKKEFSLDMINRRAQIVWRGMEDVADYKS